MAPMTRFLQHSKALLGIEANTTRHGEKLISALGALLGILLVLLISHLYLDKHSSQFMVDSMGASALLLLAVPHGTLSQPWPVFGGHIISAFIGISCQLLWPQHIVTPALAVGLAVAAMHYLRCMHPPGGATALSAVIGGPQIIAMGYQYLLTPVLINVVSILLVALLFNALFPWRRYPAHLIKLRRQPHQQAQQSELTQENFAAALQQMNSYMDVSAEDLSALFELASLHATQHAQHPSEIKAGAFYSNGKLGNAWSVRQIIDQSPNTKQHKDLVIFKTVAGAGAYATDMCRRDEFRLWARYEVQQHKGLWLPVEKITQV